MPLTITSPEMTRFSITLDQAVNFILGCYKIMMGREIFIPKIPSYKVSDLAEAIAPLSEHVISGIRPGEKMPEVLLTEDESMNAFMEETHYTIAPPDYLAGRWKDNGRVGYALPKVPKGFRYSSDTNERWLGIAELKELMK
jgi:UDP-N-acetylglucosamine 4,6-dehydratase